MKRRISLAVVGFCLLVPGFAEGSQASLDASFGDGGVTVVRDSTGGGSLGAAQAVAETASGELLVLGNSLKVRFAANGYRFDSVRATVAKLDRRGTLDQSFGKNGIAFSSGYGKKQDKRPRGGFARAIATDSRGRIVTGGSDVMEAAGNQTTNCAFVGALLKNGSLNRGFAESGQKRQCLHKPDTDPRNTVGLRGRALDLTGGGKIVLAGQALRNYGDTGPFIARFNRSGSLDRTFKGGPGTFSGEKGMIEVFRDPEIRGEFTDVKVLPHGKVLAVGSVDRGLLVVRLNRDGSLDHSFSGDGIFRVKEITGCLALNATGVAATRSDRVLISGNCPHESWVQPLVVKLRKDGRPVRSFGEGGISRPRVDFSFESSKIALQRDGRIILSGEYQQAGEILSGQFAAMRLDRTGQPDETFFDAGLFHLDDEQLGPKATDVLIDRQGGIVLVGGDEWGQRGFAVARIRVKP